MHKSFGAVKALDGLDLAVEKGSVLGLLGPNGAGKTTIVKIISTLLKNFSGEVLVDGINVAREPKRVREVIGLAGQDPAVDQWHTGFENLVMVGQLFHMSQVRGPGPGDRNFGKSGPRRSRRSHCPGVIPEGCTAGWISARPWLPGPKF